MFTIIVPYYLYAFFVYVLQLISPHFARRSHERDTPAITISTAQCYPHSCNINDIKAIKTKFDKIKLQITIIYNLLCSIRSILARCKTNLFSPVEPNSFSRREIKQAPLIPVITEKVFLIFLRPRGVEQRRATTRQMLLGESVKVLEGIRGIAALELLVKICSVLRFIIR